MVLRQQFPWSFELGRAVSNQSKATIEVMRLGGVLARGLGVKRLALSGRHLTPVSRSRDPVTTPFTT